MVCGGTDYPLPHLFPAFQNWFGVLEPTPSPALADNTYQLITGIWTGGGDSSIHLSIPEDLLLVSICSSESQMELNEDYDR